MCCSTNFLKNYAAVFCFFSAASLVSSGLEVALTATLFLESLALAISFILYTGTGDAPPSTRSNAPVSSCKYDLFAAPQTLSDWVFLQLLDKKTPHNSRDECTQMFFSTEFVLTLGVTLENLVTHLVRRHRRYSLVVLCLLKRLHVQYNPKKSHHQTKKNL